MPSDWRSWEVINWGKWGIHGNPVSGHHPKAPSHYNTIISGMIINPTLSRNAGWGMKSSLYSKQSGCVKRQQANKHKVTKRKFLQNSGLPPNQSKGWPLITTVLILTLPKFHLDTLKQKIMSYKKENKQKNLTPPVNLAFSGPLNIHIRSKLFMFLMSSQIVPFVAQSGKLKLWVFYKQKKKFFNKTRQSEIKIYLWQWNSTNTKHTDRQMHSGKMLFCLRVLILLRYFIKQGHTKKIKELRDPWFDSNVPNRHLAQACNNSDKLRTRTTKPAAATATAANIIMIMIMIIIIIITIIHLLISFLQYFPVH